MLRVLGLSMALLTAVLTGCTMSAAECDPSTDPGFFNKIGCTVSGSYAQRVELKEAELQALQAENDKLTRIGRLLSDEESMLEGNLAQRRAQHQALVSEVESLRSALKAENQLTDNLNNQLKSLEEKSAALQQLPDNTPLLERQQRLSELQAQYDQLMQMGGI